MRNRLLFLVALIVGLLQIAGCSGGKQLNRISFITAIGIDKAESGVMVHALITIPGKFTALSPGGGGAMDQRPNYVLSATGANVEEALYKMRRQSSRGLNVGHTRLIFFSHELAEDGIDSYLDLFMRREQFQINPWVAITKGSTKDVLLAKPHIPQSVTDYFVDVFSQEGADTMDVLPIYLFQFYSYLHEPGKTPYAMIISKRKDGNQLALTGLSLFRAGKMIDSLTPKETKYLQLISNRHLQYASLTLMKQSYTILSYNTRTKVTKENIQLDLHLRVELDDNPQNTTISYRNLPPLETKLAKLVKQNTEKLIRRLQALKTDPVGFGQKYRLSVDDDLKADDWSEIIFPGMAISVTVKVDIVRRGMLN